MWKIKRRLFEKKQRKFPFFFYILDETYETFSFILLHIDISKIKGRFFSSSSPVLCFTIWWHHLQTMLKKKYFSFFLLRISSGNQCLLVFSFFLLHTKKKRRRRRKKERMTNYMFAFDARHRTTANVLSLFFLSFLFQPLVSSKLKKTNWAKYNQGIRTWSILSSF